MLDFVLFILPGFASLIIIYKRDKVSNLDYSHWILIPILATYSVVSYSIAWFFYDWLCSVYSLCLTIKGPEFFDHKISLLNFILATLTASALAYIVNVFSIFSPPSSVETFLTNNREKPIMITLENGKVYVGQLVGADTWSRGDLNTVLLIPFFSGVRGLQGEKLKINNSYIKLEGDEVIYDNIGSGTPIELTILLKRVVSF